MSASTAGQLTTLFALVYAISSPVIATVAGSSDRRRLLAAGMAAFVAGGSSVAIVAGLPFGILVDQAWGWRAAMWVLVALAAVSALAVSLVPSAHAPRLSLRQRASALTDRRVLGILAGTVTVLTPGCLIIAYLPAIMRRSGAWIVIAMLCYGAGQVTGTVLVPRLIRWRGARTALILGACGVTGTTALLTATRTSDIAAAVTMALLGLAIGLTIVPPRHRLFAAVPRLAPVAVGLNGSAIYIVSALGASHHRGLGRAARRTRRGLSRPRRIAGQGDALTDYSPGRADSRRAGGGRSSRQWSSWSMAHDAPADLAQLPGLGLGEGSKTRRRTSSTWPGAGSGMRQTQPRCSSRATTWERRGSEPSVRVASTLIRRVRSGSWDSIASAWYS